MNQSAEPWIFVCVFCAGFCTWAAWQCKGAVKSVLDMLEQDQRIFGPKRSKALEKIRGVVEWAEGKDVTDRGQGT